MTEATTTLTRAGYDDATTGLVALVNEGLEHLGGVVADTSSEKQIVQDDKIGVDPRA